MQIQQNSLINNCVQLLVKSILVWIIEDTFTINIFNIGCQLAYLLTFVYSQVEEILNFAMLTGVTQTYPLRVYLVRDTDTLMDATGHAACHSKETDVLKVGVT